MNYFEYPTPYLSELKELYITPYRFSDELRASVNYMFSHPRGNPKYYKIYSNLHDEFDSNDMLKSAYLIYRHYNEHQSEFHNDIENVLPQMLVSMWKAFCSIHKHLRGTVHETYMRLEMKPILKLAQGTFIEILINDVTNNNIIRDGDEMIKIRPNKELRESNRAGLKEGDRYFESLCKYE